MKRQLRKTGFSIFLAFALVANGTLLADASLEPVQAPTGAEVPVSPPDSAPHYPRVISLTGAATFQNYSLAGTGFNAQLPQNSGVAYGLSASTGVTKNWEVWGRFGKQDTVFGNIAGVTPTSVNLLQWQLEFGMSGDLGFEAWASGLRLLLGCGIHANRTQITTPNAILSPNVAVGPVLGLAWKKPVGGFRLFSQLDLFLPNWFREDGTVSTGAYLSAYRVNWQMEFGVPVTPALWIYTGLHVGFEKQNFTGTGNRGVSDAAQSLFNFSLPVRLEITF